MSANTSARPFGFTVRTVYSCDVCGLEVTDQEKIIQHLTEHHRETEADSHNNPALSQQQDDVTSSSTVLPAKKSRWNSKRVSNERSDGQVASKPVDSKPLICPKCDRTYKYMRCFERHIEREHSISTQLTSAETVSEAQCEAALTASQLVSDTVNLADFEPKQDESRDSSTNDLLNDSDQFELQEVTDIVDDVLTSVCDDKKTVEQAQKSQMAPYCCADCPERFQTRSSFLLHTTDKHTGWTFVCTRCGRLFFERHNLCSHMRNDHNKIPDDGNATNSAERVLNSLCCNICDFRYRSEEELVKHMASHADSLPTFACSMCSGRYMTKSGLRCHVRRAHSGNRPYLCELCVDRFATAEERSEHVKQHAADLCSVCGVRLRRQTCNAMDGGATMCSVCYLEQLSSRCGLQIAGETATTNTVTQSSAQTSSLPLKYCCGVCGIRFVWRSNLRRHERKHAADNRLDDTKARHFQCLYCGRVFNRADGLHRHILRHVEPSQFQQPSFSCKLCGQKFLWKRSLVRHFRVAHPASLARRIPVVTATSNVNRRDSGVASSTSVEVDNINLDSSRESGQSGGKFGLSGKCVHDAQQDGMIAPSEDGVSSGKNDKMIFPCPECGSAFFWRSNVLRHIREQHQGNETSSRGRSSDEKHLQCSRCGRRFSRLRYLRVHLQAHESVEQSGGVRCESLLCSQCGQKMSNARLLRIHMLRHAGVRPHQCTLCDKSFFVVSQLNAHVSVVHDGNRFVCDQCGHEANSKSALKVHCRTTHPVPGVEPAFPCSLCSRRFWSPAALRRHADAHDLLRLSARKAMCSVCSLVFRHVYNLTHHIRTTHADVDCATPFACATCRQQFDSGSAFKTHYRSKHRNR